MSSASNGSGSAINGGVAPTLAAFATRLRGLQDATVASIQKLSQYTIMQARAAPATAPRQLAGMWLRELMGCPSSERQLALLYLANDFLQQTKRTPELLLAPFAAVLPRAFATMGARSMEYAEKARRVVNIWREREVYPAVDCDAFLAALQEGSADAAVRLAVAHAGDDAAIAATSGRSRIAGLDDDDDVIEEAAPAGSLPAPAAGASAAAAAAHSAEHDAAEIADLLLGTRAGVAALAAAEAAAAAEGREAGESSPDASGGRLSPLSVVESHVLPAVGARVPGPAPGGKSGQPADPAFAALAGAAAAVLSALSDAPSTALEQALQRLERAEVDTSFSRDEGNAAAALAEAAFVAEEASGLGGADGAPFPAPGPHATLAALRRYAAALSSERRVREALVTQLSAYIDAQASAGAGDDADVTSALAVLANVRAARRALATAVTAKAAGPTAASVAPTPSSAAPGGAGASLSPRRSADADDLGGAAPQYHQLQQAHVPVPQPAYAAPSHAGAYNPQPQHQPPQAYGAPAAPAYGAAAQPAMYAPPPPAYGAGGYGAAPHPSMGPGGSAPPSGAYYAPPPQPSAYGAPPQQPSAYGAPPPAYGAPPRSYVPPQHQLPPHQPPQQHQQYPPPPYQQLPPQYQAPPPYAQPPHGYGAHPQPHGGAAPGSVPGARAGPPPAPASAGRGLGMTVPAWMRQ